MTASSTSFEAATVLHRGLLPEDARSADIVELRVAAAPPRPAPGRLDLEVTFLGDESSSVFEAYWDGSWIETTPPGITVMLGHRPTGKNQDRPSTRTISIDMGEALRERPNLWAMVIADATMSPATELRLDADNI